MSHYFTAPQGAPNHRRITARIWERDYTFTTADGVFSANRLDLATSVLLRTVPPPGPQVRRVVDLGCGWGPIAVALATACEWLQVDAVDVNPRALELTAENAGNHGVADRVRVLHADPDHSAAEPGEVEYDEIWSNPPIRIGKEALHRLLLDWLPKLSPHGRAVMVVGKNLGADSLATWLTDQGWPTTRLASAKGFRVLETRRGS